MAPLSASWIAWRQRLLIALVALLALAPALYLVERTEPARRDIVYWDEFDTALAMLLRLHENTTPGRMLGELFAVNNEHRMVTSRALFAAHYALTGKVNFIALAVIGNATLLALCALLIVHVRTLPRRLTLTVLLAALFFQLEHYENFLWSGASIDHFQVVLLAAAAIICVARNTTASVIAGAGFATLATFTLAHGIVTWPICAALLWQAGNRRAVALWTGIAAVAAVAFLYGFQLNRSQGFATFSLGGMLLVARYWLALLGAVPALGHAALAPWLGGAFLLLVAWLVRREALRREPVMAALLFFPLIALALVAIGRAQHSGGVIYSRYYILGALAWAIALFLLVQRLHAPERPFRSLAWLVPLLAIFNLAANRAFAASTDSWIECRDRAAVSYLRHGEDGRTSLNLHPQPAHATALLQRATRAGFYQLPPICEKVPFPREAKPSTRMVYFVDAMTVSPRAAYLTGWAALEGQPADRHRIHLLLRAGAVTHVFTTVTESRPDVAKATQHPAWVHSGYQFVALRDQLPAGEFQIGFLIDGPDGPEYTMTAHRIDLTGEGRALLATGD